MTNNFQRVVGKGGFGVVYHGTLNGYEQVAVKVLSQSSTQGYKQFRAEVSITLNFIEMFMIILIITSLWISCVFLWMIRLIFL